MNFKQGLRGAVHSIRSFLYLFTLPWQRHIHQPSHQKSEVCVANFRVANFGNQRIKGFREKGDWNTGIKTVFSHLKVVLNWTTEWTVYLKKKINQRHENELWYVNFNTNGIYLMSPNSFLSTGVRRIPFRLCASCSMDLSRAYWLRALMSCFLIVSLPAR